MGRHSTIYVGGLSSKTKSNDILKKFDKFGRIIRCDIHSGKNGHERNYAFVEFEDSKDAQDAFESLKDNLVVDGKKLFLEWARKSPSRGWRYDDYPPRLPPRRLPPPPPYIDPYFRRDPYFRYEPYPYGYYPPYPPPPHYRRYSPPPPPLRRRRRSPPPRYSPYSRRDRYHSSSKRDSRESSEDRRKDKYTKESNKRREKLDDKKKNENIEEDRKSENK